MSDWPAQTAIPLLTALFAATVAGPVYLLRTAFGRVGRSSPNSIGEHAREVRSESIWGMVLAYPALHAMLLCAVEGPWGPPQWAIFVATLLVYLVGFMALKAKPLTAPLRWMPAVFAIVAPPSFLVALGIEGEGLIGLFLTMTLFGLSYLVWCLVGMRFGIAVGRRQQAELDNARCITMDPPAHRAAGGV